MTHKELHNLINKVQSASDNDGDAFFLASVHNGKVNANISCINGGDLANLFVTVLIGDPRMRDVFAAALSGYDTLQNSN